jgi:hypothetical protein
MDTSRIALDTGVVLRIQHESRNPSEVTDLLGISPQGFDIKISCVWLGQKGGCGGPKLTPEIMSRLADLGVELWFNFALIDVPKPQ